MNPDFNDIDVISELELLSSQNKYTEITNLLRENFYQFNNEPTKLIAILTIRIYYNMLLKNFNDIDSDFELIESIFKNKLDHQFPYTRRSKCPFSTFLIYSYYPHLKGLSYLSVERLYNLLDELQSDLDDKIENYRQKHTTDSPMEPEQNEDSIIKSPDFRDKLLESTDKVSESVEGSPRKILEDDTYMYKKFEKHINKILITVVLISDVLLSLLRPKEAINILTSINLKYSPKHLSSNLILSLIYRKLGYLDDSERHMNMISDSKNQNFYKGILKIFEKDYEGAMEDFKSLGFLEKIKRSRKPISGNEMVFVNNVAMATLYANKSQDANKLFFQYKFDKEGLQAHRGISSNADVLRELSIYN